MTIPLRGLGVAGVEHVTVGIVGFRDRQDRAVELVRRTAGRGFG
jgi:hypothetical protein